MKTLPNTSFRICSHLYIYTRAVPPTYHSRDRFGAVATHQYTSAVLLTVYYATLRGQQQDTQNMCTAPSTTTILLADSAGEVECQGDGN